MGKITTITNLKMSYLKFWSNRAMNDLKNKS